MSVQAFTIGYLDICLRLGRGGRRLNKFESGLLQNLRIGGIVRLKSDLGSPMKVDETKEYNSNAA
jgi:hypothetical protein